MGERGIAALGLGALGLGLVAACAWWLGGPSAPSTPHPSLGGPGVPRGAVPVTVVRLVDGDTLIVRSPVAVPGVLAAGRTRVRLLEIDTPESVAPGAAVECYAHRATAELARLAPRGSGVRVLADRDLLDGYGRTLLYVWNARGSFVNLELVRSGAAEAVLYEPNDRYIGLMRRAEARARAREAGLWGRCDHFGQPA